MPIIGATVLYILLGYSYSCIPGVLRSGSSAYVSYSDFALQSSILVWVIQYGTWMLCSVHHRNDNMLYKCIIVEHG